MLSTKDAQRHTPSWLSGEKAPVYLIRPGSVIERSLVEAELAGEYQAGRVFAFELLEAFQKGVRALLPDDPEADQLVSLAAAEAGGETLSAEEARQVADARVALGEHWPDYRALNARIARRKEIAPVLALRRFCVGWENVEVPFARGPDGLVTLDALARLDPLEMLSAGNHAYGLLFPGELEGNSPPPSQSDDGPTTSTSDAPSPAAGKSKARSGRKTRA